MTDWNIGLSSWIVQDGQYPDFEVGQIAEFGVEFWIPKGTVAAPSNADVSATNIDACRYDTVANVAFQTANTVILDIGLLVYGDTVSLPADPNVAVELMLSVDPFHYFGGLADVPPLVYSWRIASILMQTAPFIEVAPRLRMRDPQRLGYKEILKTDAWRDDGGFAEYVLCCELLPVPSKSTSATAINV